MPSEVDGVAAAGKRRTRWAHNDVGILQGEVATRGETIANKNDLTGAGSGAPNQDHFTNPRGTKVVDGEFPLGKKIWAHKH